MYIQIVREIDVCAEGACPADAEIVDIHYRMDDMSLCVALSNGDLVSWLSDGKVSMMTLRFRQCSFYQTYCWKKTTFLLFFSNVWYRIGPGLVSLFYLSYIYS